MNKRWFRNLALASVAALAVAGCSSSGATPPAGGPPSSGTPFNPANASTNYKYLQNVPITGVPTTSPVAKFSFDISYSDPATGDYYLSDRSTQGVDVVNESSLTYVLTAGKGDFTGLGSQVAGGPPATNAGPNGIVPIGNNLVMAGDGNSTLKVVNIATGALVTSIPTVNPTTSGLFSFCGAPSTGTANQRVDEMAFDSVDNVVLAINDAACPPFGTFFSASAPYSILGSVAFPTASGGAEQPTWDPKQDLFLMAFPQTTTNPNGEVDAVSPKTYSIVNSFPMTSNCEPNGTALGQNENLFLGCSAQPVNELVTINATNGAVVNTITGYGGADEVWYNPGSNRFYCGCGSNNNKANPLLVVADGNGNYLDSVPTSVGAHSVASDQNTGRVFVPMSAPGASPAGIGLNVFTPQ